MARAHLGDKHIDQTAIDLWVSEKGYDKPLFFNSETTGLSRIQETIFFEKSLKLFIFEFGISDNGRDIAQDIQERMWPSLAVAVPTFLIGLWVNICIALLVLLLRESSFDRYVVAIFVGMMSISYLFYIIGGQYLFARLWKWVPVSGFHGGMGNLALRYFTRDHRCCIGHRWRSQVIPNLFLRCLIARLCQDRTG